MSITVYSKPSCVQCDATYRALNKYGLEYESINVTQDEEALAFIRDELGYQSAPVVYVDDVNNEALHWSGYRPDRIKTLAAEHPELLRVSTVADTDGSLALAHNWTNARN